RLADAFEHENLREASRLSAHERDEDPLDRIDARGRGGRTDGAKRRHDQPDAGCGGGRQDRPERAGPRGAGGDRGRPPARGGRGSAARESNSHSAIVDIHADVSVYIRYSIATALNASTPARPRRVSSHPLAGSARKGPVNVSVSIASPDNRTFSTSAKRVVARQRQSAAARIVMWTTYSSGTIANAGPIRRSRSAIVATPTSRTTTISTPTPAANNP